MQIDPIILPQLDQFGINVNFALKCIEANKHSNVTTSYYLLLLKHLRNGGKSIADISSDEFQTAPIGKRPNFKATANTENIVTPLITDYLNLDFNMNQLKESTAPINIKKYCNSKSNTKYF